MSIVRTKKLKQLGFETKKERRKARKYIHTFPKCNKAYAYNNIACNYGLMDDFWLYGSVIDYNSL
jgi:hypothetical protein